MITYGYKYPNLYKIQEDKEKDEVTQTDIEEPNKTDGSANFHV